MTSDSPVCGHCGSRLATLACPTCFKMMFREAKFCPHCGSAAVAWTSSKTRLKCPGCDADLCRGEVGAVVLHQCGKCFGFWVDSGTFERILRDARQQAVLPALAQPMPAPSAKAIPKIRYLRCPECRTLMNRLNFAEYSGIVVDVCRTHGTWFDAHELHHIVQFIREGGLDKARDRKLVELADERRRMESVRKMRAPEPALLGWDHSTSDLSGFRGVVVAIGRLLTRNS